MRCVVYTRAWRSKKYGSYLQFRTRAKVRGKGCLLSDETYHGYELFEPKREREAYKRVFCGAKPSSSLIGNASCVFGPRKTINYPLARRWLRRAYVVLFLLPNPRYARAWHTASRPSSGRVDESDRTRHAALVTGSRESLRFPDKRLAASQTYRRRDRRSRRRLVRGRGFLSSLIFVETRQMDSAKNDRFV